MSTEPVFRDDAYQKSAEARVIDITDRGGIVLDRTVFYATSGGQPGDRGRMQWGGGDIEIATTVYAEDRATIVHMPAEGAALPAIGAAVTATLDFAHRHALMRMHTALHLMCAIVPFPVTGGQIGPESSRLDFDVADAGALDKDDLTARLDDVVAGAHDVTTRWITDDELDANPGLVRTMSVQPPRGSGRIRLVAIGEDGGVDLQPCGGTHVANTREIGAVAVTKIEKKGKQNRRVRVALVG